MKHTQVDCFFKHIQILSQQKPYLCMQASSTEIFVMYKYGLCEQATLFAFEKCSCSSPLSISSWCCRGTLAPSPRPGHPSLWAHLGFPFSTRTGSLTPQGTLRPILISIKTPDVLFPSSPMRPFAYFLNFRIAFSYVPQEAAVLFLGLFYHRVNTLTSAVSHCTL